MALLAGGQVEAAERAFDWAWPPSVTTAPGR